MLLHLVGDYAHGEYAENKAGNENKE